MFTYPALTIGFLFVAVPLLVHLINMLRHRRQRWAAMDFLLASYRRQKKWIVLRQLLLLLARLAVAALLIALLCGWTGGRRLLGALGGETTHHVFILDDSYSMGDLSGGVSAYTRSLQALQDLTRGLSADDGNHQLTVLRASRSALAVRGGRDSGDAVADLSAQTITSDGQLIGRVMATEASSIRTDLVDAIEMAAGLIDSTPADSSRLYLTSDFRQRDWESPQRLAESLRRAATAGADVRMIDCATNPAPNLGITKIAPAPDVWVAGVPVVVSVTVKNYATTPAKNVALTTRVIRYGADVNVADTSRVTSGVVEPQPAIVIESLAPGAEITKTFQVYVTETGTHAIDISLPDDALAIDNRRVCTLPLSDTERVLIIDDDPDGRGSYHVASVLNPGSQVRIGAIPDIQPSSFLRAITLETLATYRAVYLIDLPELSENAAAALAEYVSRGGGVCWFLGNNVNAERYNEVLLGSDRFLLPGKLAEPKPLEPTTSGSADLMFGDPTPLLQPLRSSGDSAFALVGLKESWMLAEPARLPKPDPSDAARRAENPEDPEQPNATTAETTLVDQPPRVLNPVLRRDGQPFVTQHELGRGRMITVLSGLDGSWTNWPSDPTFVVFLLQANAWLWSGAAPPTYHYVDEPLTRTLPADRYASTAIFLPPAGEPPRVSIEWVVDEQATPSTMAAGPAAVPQLSIDPSELVIDGVADIDDMLRPGLAELMLTRDDGSTEIVPVAAVIRAGESDLERANPVEIRRNLEPLDVEFVSSAAWSEVNRNAGSSTLAMILLAGLALMLGLEQLLGYWASYHVAGGPVAGGNR